MSMWLFRACLERQSIITLIGCSVNTVMHSACLVDLNVFSPTASMRKRECPMAVGRASRASILRRPGNFSFSLVHDCDA